MVVKLSRFAPLVFVLLWSTGFVGAKYALPYADPFIFLSTRVLAASVLLFVVALDINFLYQFVLVHPDT